MNVTWVNQMMEFGGKACSDCSCMQRRYVSCNALQRLTSMWSTTRVGRGSLELLKVTVYDEDFSFYVTGLQSQAQLVQPEHCDDNYTSKQGEHLRDRVNIDPRDDKAQPVADVVFLVNKTTLADHYRLLGEVLDEIRRNDTTSWIWNKAKIELNELAKKIERDLAEYNAVGIGIATVMDEVTVCVFPLQWPYIITFECLDLRASQLQLVYECCASLYAAVVGCTLGCIGSVYGCISCIIFAVYGLWGALNSCYHDCPAMDVCLAVDLIFWRIAIACARLW
ncbi:hypothetical protein Igag_1987 [Ignisphaera aggregans DSM 17230]|uniref:Uncharacterized protein n=1 Tax=Ignisphaera aggregans (strain DSM 17230 / JCM 13409 / AQ1.S1) TaxID=583356 RepID=E0STJ2_IGNAA|nr:hypothetical protein Igag_1987 [Ignisphaera aggregans DSM 17230]